MAVIAYAAQLQRLLAYPSISNATRCSSKASKGAMGLTVAYTPTFSDIPGFEALCSASRSKYDNPPQFSSATSLVWVEEWVDATTRLFDMPGPFNAPGRQSFELPPCSFPLLCSAKHDKNAFHPVCTEVRNLCRVFPSIQFSQ